MAKLFLILILISKKVKISLLIKSVYKQFVPVYLRGTFEHYDNNLLVMLVRTDILVTGE